jgi:hypothetical protein
MIFIVQQDHLIVHSSISYGWKISNVLKVDFFKNNCYAFIIWYEIPWSYESFCCV